MSRLAPLLRWQPSTRRRKSAKSKKKPPRCGAVGMGAEMSILFFFLSLFVLVIQAVRCWRCVVCVALGLCAMAVLRLGEFIAPTVPAAAIRLTGLTEDPESTGLCDAGHAKSATRRSARSFGRDSPGGTGRHLSRMPTIGDVAICAMEHIPRQIAWKFSELG